MSKILTFEQEWVKSKQKTHILRFMREAIGVNEVQWSDLTTLNLSKVREYITGSFAGNTAVTYLAIIKAFLARYKDESIIPCSTPEKQLKTKHVPSQNVYLTEEEIERIENYQPRSECEADVKASFLIECYMGARRSDVEAITDDNIIDNRIVYVSRKTHVECSVPIHRNLLKYLHYKQVKQRDRSIVIRTIQRICKKVGITEEVRIFYHGREVKQPKYKFVGTHTARRSFCSNLARRGVDIFTIAALAGHKDISMTERYVITNVKELSNQALAFFNS